MPSAIIVNDTQWKIGGLALAPACNDAAKRGLKEAVDRGFEITQSTVHVDTGRLKDSGRVVETEEGDGNGFNVIYGGEDYDVDYAGWHELEYPFLAPGMQQGLASFGEGPDLLIGPFG